MAETYAKDLTPVDTGTLRNSITHRVETKGKMIMVIIGSNVHYAPYVEFGTGNLYQPLAEWVEYQAKKGHGLDKWHQRCNVWRCCQRKRR